MTICRGYFLSTANGTAQRPCSHNVPVLSAASVLRRALTVACFLLVAAGVALFYSNWLIVNASQHLTWNDIQTVPARNVGLVLGAKPGNRYFTRRINTAAALYHAGKVKWLLVSGDNGKRVR